LHNYPFDEIAMMRSILLLLGVFILTGQAIHSQIGVDAQFGGIVSNEPFSLQGIYTEFEISPKLKETHWLKPMFIIPATMSFMSDNHAQNYYLGLGMGVQFTKWNRVIIGAGFSLNKLFGSTDEEDLSGPLSGYSRKFESFNLIFIQAKYQFNDKIFIGTRCFLMNGDTGYLNVKGVFGGTIFIGVNLL
jgi:hypothetical protein